VVQWGGSVSHKNRLFPWNWCYSEASLNWPYNQIRICSLWYLSF
jgi:hypothetical protein